MEEAENKPSVYARAWDPFAKLPTQISQLIKVITKLIHDPPVRLT